jgi:hypothetical protein
LKKEGGLFSSNLNETNILFGNVNKNETQLAPSSAPLNLPKNSNLFENKDNSQKEEIQNNLFGKTNLFGSLGMNSNISSNLFGVPKQSDAENKIQTANPINPVSNSNLFSQNIKPAQNTIFGSLTSNFNKDEEKTGTQKDLKEQEPKPQFTFCNYLINKEIIIIFL